MEKVKVFTPEKSEKQKRIHFSKNNKKKTYCWIKEATTEIN